MRYSIIALSLLVTGSLQAKASLVIYGEARDPIDKHLLYTEEHQVTQSRHDVAYRFPDGQPLADKNIHYQKGYQTPVFQLYDHRFGRQSGSKWETGEWILWQQEKSGDREEEHLSPRDNLVIDAGFNHFVIDHFAELSAGKTLEFTFAITDPPMGIDMRIGPVDCAEPGFEPEDKESLCLKASSRNALLRWFVPDIYLAYSQHEHFSLPVLVLYQGPSNLPDNEDKGQNVRIEYRYRPSQGSTP